MAKDDLVGTLDVEWLERAQAELRATLDPGDTHTPNVKLSDEAEARVRELLREELNRKAARQLFDHDFEEKHAADVRETMIAERQRAEMDRAAAEVRHMAAATSLRSERVRFATSIAWLLVALSFVYSATMFVLGRYS